MRTEFESPRTVWPHRQAGSLSYGCAGAVAADGFACACVDSNDLRCGLIVNRDFQVGFVLLTAQDRIRGCVGLKASDVFTISIGCANND
jgi:hypothetical protein